MKVQAEQQQGQNAPQDTNQLRESMEEQGEEEEQEQSEQPGQHVPRTLLQLSDQFSGQQPPLMVGRTRSGSTRTFRGGTALGAILRAEGVNISAAMLESANFDDHMAMQAAFMMPGGIASFLRREPTTLKQSKALPGRPQWKRAMDVDMVGLITHMVWDQVPRPTNQVVFGIKILY